MVCSMTVCHGRYDIMPTQHQDRTKSKYMYTQNQFGIINELAQNCIFPDKGTPFFLISVFMQSLVCFTQFVSFKLKY